MLIKKKNHKTISAAMAFAPPGHFYSPYPLIENIEKSYDITYTKHETMDGLDLNIEEQIELFQQVSSMSVIGPWHHESVKNLLYFYNNWFFRFADANAVWHFSQIYKPKRVIEVGSGYSTICWIDCFAMLNLDTLIICIEPFPERLSELIKTCKERIVLKQLALQEISPNLFYDLEENDVLFIDSTHVSKSGSDVNHLFFHIIPNLKSGVLIHIHDIFWPFEYPKDWYKEGRAWNEAFLLRAFLQYNSAFKIMRFNSYLGKKHADFLKGFDDRFVTDSGGSIWLIKT